MKSLACLFLLLLAPLVLAQPVPRVESVDPTGARAVFVPQTQPADVLPRLDFYDINSRKTVFVPQSQPTTQPTDTGIVDGIPYPNPPAFVAAPGKDLSKLNQDAALTTGTYTASGDIKRNCVGLPGTAPVLKLRTGQCPQYPDVFAGIRVDGGGVPKSDELKTAGPRAGRLVHSCTIVNSEGFGLLTNTPGCRVTQCVIANNKSGGVGGTQSGSVLVDNCEIYGNNVAYGMGNSNKWTRAVVVCRDNDYHGNAGRDIWADNYVQSLMVLRCRFRGTVPDRSGKPWKAGNIAGEISDRLIVKDCVFVNDVAASIYVNEMQVQTEITGNHFGGKSALVIEVRNMARGTPFHELKHVYVHDNTYDAVVKKYIGLSGASTKKVTLSGNDIVVKDAVQVRIPN